MIKLYRRDDDGVLRYHESWADLDDGKIADHRGRVGERGAVDHYTVPDGADPDACVEDMLAQARTASYAELPAGCNEGGWHGLGEWVGASMGSGQKEIAYSVVDVDIAVRIIRSALERSPYPMYIRINVQEPDE